MESKLEHLIQKIKSDGIDEARKAADEIIAKAEKDAETIVKKARANAEQLIADSEKEAGKLMSNAEAALKQAARDTVLVTKEKLLKLFAAAFKQKIGATMSPGFMKEMVLKMTENWGKDKAVELLVSERDLKQLRDLVVSDTRTGLKEAVTIKVDKGISRGFRVGLRGSDVYYDLTDESIAEFLGEFLNPGIREILDKT